MSVSKRPGRVLPNIRSDTVGRETVLIFRAKRSHEIKLKGWPQRKPWMYIRCRHHTMRWMSSCERLLKSSGPIPRLPSRSQERDLRNERSETWFTTSALRESISPDPSHGMKLAVSRSGRPSLLNVSWLDNMPISILEAFACGTPVVSTAPESMRYLVENGRTGLLSGTRDAHVLAGNAIRLLQNPELAARLAQQAYE